jgi:hypothetical protein
MWGYERTTFDLFDCPAHARASPVRTARVGSAVDELLGERRGVAPKQARCRTTRVEDVGAHVRSRHRLVVAKTLIGRAGQVVPGALT